MSDDVRCDHCGKAGRRPRFYAAPDGWLFLEAKDSRASDPEQATIFVYACSKECADNLWQIGRGPRLEQQCCEECCNPECHGQWGTGCYCCHFNHDESLSSFV